MLKTYNEMIPRIPAGMKKMHNNKDLYLYGNSTYALQMLEELRKYDIGIKGVLVSKGYFYEEEFEGHHVYEAEEFIDKSEDPICIVVGFLPWVHMDLVNRLADNLKINQIYILQGCGVLYSNGFNFPMNKKLCLIDNYYVGLIKRDLNSGYYMENYKLFCETYDWLCDEKSKKTMEDYLTGHIELNEFPMLDVWKQEDVAQQYFPDDIIHLSDSEVFVDCGAYTGDTLGGFLKLVKDYKKYYALEPDSRRFDELKGQINSDKIQHVPVGAWSKKDKLFFSTEFACGEIDCSAEDGDSIDVDAVDNIVTEDDKVTFIKMDIEGSELEALRGSEKIIKRDKPKLAICVYHKREDLIAIPQFIKSIVPEYKLYLRVHFPYASELVLYGVCE